jgi:hypothetical protein
MATLVKVPSDLVATPGMLEGNGRCRSSHAARFISGSAVPPAWDADEAVLDGRVVTVGGDRSASA